jgi:hypothetical protein
MPVQLSEKFIEYQYLKISEEYPQNKAYHQPRNDDLEQNENWERKQTNEKKI